MIFDGFFVAKVLGCQNMEPQQLSRKICSVCIDSREWEEGALFVALVGERVDGHQFIASLIENGCRDFLVRESWFKENEGQCEEYKRAYGAAFFIVGDTLSALQDLAEAYRRLFSDLTVIGVTGSNGKTTVKELLASVFSRVASTVWNKGNLNSEIGLPLSVFSIRPEHRYAVLEMGINHEGEMDILSRVARPETVVVTNIGSAHIGELGSREAIAREKRKAFSFFDKKSAAVIPERDDFADFLAKETEGEVLFFGVNSEPAYRAVEGGLRPEGTEFLLDGEKVFLPLPGVHNVANALAVVKTARRYGISFADIRAGLEAVKPVPGRIELIEGDILLIKDCYNANPESMKKGLEFLSGMSGEGRKVAVIADMLELGHESEAAHSKTGEFAFGLSLDAIFFFGKEMANGFQASKKVRGETDSFLTDKFCTDIFWFEEYIDLKDAVLKYVKKGDIVLLKGSRSMRLERLAEVLPV